MTAKKTASHPAAEFVAENGNKGIISASQLSELVGRDGKTVRARLRKIAARDQGTLKGARWAITATIATSEFDHYAALDAKAEAQAS